MKQYVCIGSYTERMQFGNDTVFEGKGKGIFIASFENGKLTVCSEAAVVNPSFLCIDEANRMIYAVNETKEYMGKPGGSLTQLSYDASGRMQVQCVYPTDGKDPCHILLSADRSFAAVSNYSSGSMTVYELDGHAALTGRRQLFLHKGAGVNPSRQEGPHTHSTVLTPDGAYLYAIDLGIDRMKAYRIEKDGLVPSPEADAVIPDGSGPRCGEFSKDGRHFYLICEISSRILHFEYHNGRMILKESVSTLPEAYCGINTCADLHITPDGRYLYASNRGHDSLVCCRIAQDGSLRVTDIIPCGGKTPRNFAIDPDGAYLLAANQDSDTIVVFQIGDEGHLTEVSRFTAGSPVCIRFFALS